MTDRVPRDQESDALLALHRRLLNGDPLASSEAAAMLLGPLVEETQRQYPRLDEQIVADAVVDALLDYFEHPSGAGKRGEAKPRAFLRRAAWRNAANLLRGSKRSKLREQKWATDPDTSSVEHDSALGTLIQDEEKTKREGRITALMLVLPDRRDREVLRLRLQGERRVALFAAVLGVTHLPASEQRRIVKRAKDRVDKVVRRARDRKA